MIDILIFAIGFVFFLIIVFIVFFVGTIISEFIKSQTKTKNNELLDYCKTCGMQLTFGDDNEIYCENCGTKHY